jgi:hypothetical protein
MNLSRTTLARNGRTANHLLSVSALWAVLLLFGSASLSQAAIIQFTGGSAPNNLGVTAGSVLSTSASVGTISGPISTLNVSGAPSGNGAYNGLSLALAYNPDSLTVTGSIPVLNGNLAASSTLLTINFSAAGLTADTTSGNFVLNFPTNVTSIVVSPTLLADLGLSAAASLTALTDTATSSGFTFQGQPLYFQSSSSLSLTTTPAAAAPEPSFRLMTTFGLVFMVFATRRKFLRAGSVRPRSGHSTSAPAVACS